MPATLFEALEPSRQDSLKAAAAAEHLSEGHLDQSELPEIVVQLLSQILNEIAHGRALSVIAVDSDMTTNEAADYLNVSRPYLIKLLNEGKLPFHLVGTHKRVYFQDIKRYKEEQKARSYALLEELQAETQALNVGAEQTLRFASRSWG